MTKCWEVEDVVLGNVVARMAATEEEALAIYDKFFSSEFMVVMAIGWSEGRRLKDGSIMQVFGWDGDVRRLHYRVVETTSELPLTYKKK